MVLATLLEKIDPALAQRLIASLPKRQWCKGETIIRQGDSNDELLLLESGEAEVWRQPADQPEPLLITTLRTGNLAGEISALGRTPATATVIARSDCSAVVIKLAQLPEELGVRTQVADNLLRHLVERLSATNDQLLEKHRAELAIQLQLQASLQMVARILITMCFYVFLLPIAHGLKAVLPSDSLMSFGFILFLTGMTWSFQWRAPLAPRVFGFVGANWRKQAGRGLLWTLPWLGVTLLLKYWLVILHPEVTRLFEPHRAINSTGGMQWSLWGLLLILYGAMSFAQEYVRAVTQGALHFFYQTVGRADRWKSLLIANLIFAILHIHLGPVFAVMGFAAGLLWGWIFQREQSYLAAAVSHVVLGIWVVFILGVPY